MSRKILKFIGFILITQFGIQAFATPIGAIVKRADGWPWIMKLGDAADYCFSINSSLPSARDFAAEAVTRGLVIKETQYPNVFVGDPKIQAEFSALQATCPPENNSCYGIVSKNLGDRTRVVDFYFKFDKYIGDPKAAEDAVFPTATFNDYYAEYEANSSDPHFPTFMNGLPPHPNTDAAQYTVRCLQN